MSELKDRHLQSAIDNLKSIGELKGYMVSISVLNEDTNTINHSCYLGANFKHEDIDMSIEEHRKGFLDLVGANKDNSKIVEGELDLSRGEGEVALDDKIPTKEEKE
jgi:hypothetical protein